MSSPIDALVGLAISDIQAGVKSASQTALIVATAGLVAEDETAASDDRLEMLAAGVKSGRVQIVRI